MRFSEFVICSGCSMAARLSQCIGSPLYLALESFDVMYRSAAPALKDLLLIEDLPIIIVACGQDPECRACQTDGFLNTFNSQIKLHSRPPVWQQAPSTYLPIIRGPESKRRTGETARSIVLRVLPESFVFQHMALYQNIKHTTRSRAVRHLAAL